MYVLSAYLGFSRGSTLMFCLYPYICTRGFSKLFGINEINSPGSWAQIYFLRIAIASHVDLSDVRTHVSVLFREFALGRCARSLIINGCIH